jgi:hypothetical protein
MRRRWGRTSMAERRLACWTDPLASTCADRERVFTTGRGSESFACVSFEVMLRRCAARPAGATVVRDIVATGASTERPRAEAHAADGLFHEYPIGARRGQGIAATGARSSPVANYPVSSSGDVTGQTRHPIGPCAPHYSTVPGSRDPLPGARLPDGTLFQDGRLRYLAGCAPRSRHAGAPGQVLRPLPRAPRAPEDPGQTPAGGHLSSVVVP